MKVQVFDYGAGNLHSLLKALHSDGSQVAVISDASEVGSADVLVLPGVGAFAAACVAMAPHRTRLAEAIRGGLPVVGICLGMQLLFETSEEGEGQGLGVLEGAVTRLRSRRAPHMGWAALEGALPLDAAYFAHSYACRPRQGADVIAWATHEQDRFPAAVGRRQILGFQFHPEKSGAEGAALLRRSVREAAQWK